MLLDALHARRLEIAGAKLECLRRHWRNVFVLHFAIKSLI